jgi:hypothetical protein
MGSNRSYDFVTGFETSTAPTATTPSADADIMNKGYADDTYAKLQYWGDAVADTTALKAVGSADRSDKQARVKDDDKTIWVFDSSSTATEDGTTVIQPTSGTGRWLVASGGSGGSSGTASASELLQTQNEIAGYGLGTRALDNSVRASGLEVPAHTYFTGYLIDNYTSGGASMNVVWNPVQVRSADQNMDSTTNWTATGAGASLTTSATAKIGSTSIRIDKNGTAVEAGIRYDQGSQILAVGANYRVWFWVNLPSITNLSNVLIRMYADSTSNFRTWVKTVDYAGSALATGWNLISVDLSDTTGSTTGGTGWTYTTLSRYQELGVTTSSAGQTYTAVLFDALNFSHGDIASWAPKYLEFTAHDTSNKRDIVIASSNTRQDGVLTLGASVASNFTAGISNSDSCKIKRSSMSWSQAGLIGFDTSLSSGTIATEEEIRLTRVLRESLSGNYGAYVDMYTPQIYKVTAVGGSTIDVADSENHSANLLNGDYVHIFTTTYSAGEPHFTLLATRSMSAGSSHSSGTTTLTLTTTGIAVGDYVVKQHLTVSSSVVSATANESFSAMSYDTSPNGAQLIGSRSYPNPNNVYAHWWLGGPSETLALKDQTWNGRTLTKVGSPNLSDAFKSGKYSYSGITSANYVRTASSTGQTYDGTGELIQVSLWVYYDGTFGTDRTIIAPYSDSGGNRSWRLYVEAGGGTVSLRHYSTGSSTVIATGGMTSGTWNHIVVQSQTINYQQYYLNGVKHAATTPHTMDASVSTSAFYVGVTQDSAAVDTGIGTPAVNLKIADCIVWRDGALLTQSDVNYLYNAGVPQWIGYQPAVLRNEYAVTGQSGQRISMKAKLNRTTTGVSPYILNAGMIKTG